MPFVYSMDGFISLMTLFTIVFTAVTAGVNPYNYMYWYFANIKFRTEEYRLKRQAETGNARQIFALPTKKKCGKNKNLHEEEFFIDHIDQTGLDVFSYKELILREKEILKKAGKLDDS